MHRVSLDSLCRALATATIMALHAVAQTPDPARDLIAVEADVRGGRARCEHAALIARLQTIAEQGHGTEVATAAHARATELSLEAELLGRLQPLATLRGQNLSDLLPRLAQLELGAFDCLTLAGLATAVHDRALAETVLARARELDDSLLSATDQALCKLRNEPLPAGGYHRYRGEWLALAARDAARALDEALAALAAVASPAGVSLPLQLRSDISNRAAFAALGNRGPAALRDAAGTLRTALSKRYLLARAFFASYASPGTRAALLDLDKRSRERAQAAVEKIRAYDKPQQGEVDALRTEVATLMGQIDIARAQDRRGYTAAAAADAERVRHEVAGMEDALRAVDACLRVAGLPGLDKVEITPAADAPTNAAHTLPGRSWSGLEDCVWLALGSRAGLLGETIARADELLRHLDRLTPWERLLVEDLRDDALRDYTRDVVATSLDEQERAFLDTLNSYRRTLRLPCLEPDERLVRSSRKHSEEMVRLNYFGHISPIAERRTPTDRARLEGFNGGVGENCLAGSVDGKGAFEGWYRSPGHHRNMIGEGPLLGVGATMDRGMWTMVIGAGDLSWRVAHRDATPAQRAETATQVTRFLAEVKTRKGKAAPAAGNDAFLPALLRAALPAVYETNTGERALSAELLRVAVSMPALPEQRVLLEVAAQTGKERLALDLSLPSLANSTKVAPQPKLAVPARGDGPSLKAPLNLLTKSDRQRLAKQLGGGARTERMVERGLAFLARCQDVDGAWRARSFANVVPGLAAYRDPGLGNAEWELAMTGLAILCFTTTGNSTQQGEYAKQVDKGTRFLMSKVLDFGRFETSASHYAYNHALATQALCEVYAYTADPMIGNYAQLAVDWLVDAQHRGSGGWRYEPDQAGDTSVVGWVVMALNSAHKAHLDVGGFRDALRFLDGVTEKHYYRVGYLGPTDEHIFSNRLATVAMTSRRFLGQDISDPRLVWPAIRLLDDLPSAEQPDYYQWYYGTLAMFQMGGDYWRSWSEHLTPALLAMHVEKEGQPIDGSFVADKHYSGTGGRLYSTAMAILCATAWYRYDRAPKPKLTPFTGDVDKACAPYIAVLLDPPDERVLRLTVAKLSDDLGPYAVPALLRVLAQGHKREAALRIAQLVEQVVEPMNEAALLQNLGVSEDGEVRKTLMRALERVCSNKSCKALIDAMRTDHNPHVRGQAARALGALGAREALPELNARLAVEPDPFAKEQVQAALRRLAARDALDTLVAVAVGDAAGRAAIRTALLPLERDQLSERIAELAAAQPKLYKRLIEVLSKEREHAAIPLLVELLDCDAPPMRESAIGLLYALTHQNHGFDAKHDSAARADPLRRWRTWWEAQQHTFGKKTNKR